MQAHEKKLLGVVVNGESIQGDDNGILFAAFGGSDCVIHPR